MGHNLNPSRRLVLKRTALLAGVALTANILRSNEVRAEKASQDAMKYQNKPDGDKRCSNCLNFLHPSSCAIVEGTISANGYCMAWAKKT